MKKVIRGKIEELIREPLLDFAIKQQLLDLAIKRTPKPRTLKKSFLRKLVDSNDMILNESLFELRMTSGKIFKPSNPYFVFKDRRIAEQLREQELREKQKSMPKSPSPIEEYLKLPGNEEKITDILGIKDRKEAFSFIKLKKLMSYLNKPLYDRMIEGKEKVKVFIRKKHSNHIKYVRNGDECFFYYLSTRRNFFNFRNMKIINKVKFYVELAMDMVNHIRDHLQRILLKKHLKLIKESIDPVDGKVIKNNIYENKILKDIVEKFDYDNTFERGGKGLIRRTVRKLRNYVNFFCNLQVHKIAMQDSYFMGCMLITEYGPYLISTFRKELGISFYLKKKLEGSIEIVVADYLYFRDFEVTFAEEMVVEPLLEEGVREEMERRQMEEKELKSIIESQQSHEFGIGSVRPTGESNFKLLKNYNLKVERVLKYPVANFYEQMVLDFPNVQSLRFIMKENAPEENQALLLEKIGRNANPFTNI